MKLVEPCDYDRSLEYYFNQSLANTFLIKSDRDKQPENWIKEADQLRKFRNTFNIQHVCGQIGPLYSNIGGVLIRDFVPPKRFNDLNNFYNGIHLVENRQDNREHFIGIQKIVKEADIIYCIGFGFDILNMERVGLTQKDLKCKAIFATSMEIGLAERISILNQISKDKRDKFSWYNPDNNITKFLRDLYINDESIISMLLDRTLHPEDEAHKLMTWTRTGATRPVKTF